MGVFPLTECDSDSNIICDPILWKQFKYAQTDTLVPTQISVKILMGLVSIFSDQKEYLNLNLTRSV